MRTLILSSVRFFALREYTCLFRKCFVKLRNKLRNILLVENNIFRLQIDFCHLILVSCNIFFKYCVKYNKNISHIMQYIE